MIEFLTIKDLKFLETALSEKRDGVILERKFWDGRRLRVSLGPSTKAWSVPWLIRLEQVDGNKYSTQYFTSVEEMFLHG